MITNGTFSDYYRIISNLNISEITLYYFIIYIFISLAERVIKEKISLHDFTFKGENILKLNRKIIFALIIFYIFGVVDQIILKFLPTKNIFIELSQAGLVFVFGIKILDVVLYGFKQELKSGEEPDSNGLVANIIRLYMKKIARKKSDVKPDKYFIKCASGRAKSSLRKEVNLFISDLFLVLIVFQYTFCLNPILAVFMGIAGIWFLAIHRDTLEEVRMRAHTNFYGFYHQPKK